MRIGMMADVYKPHVSGITNYIDLNKRAMEKAGHDVYVFTFGEGDYKDDEPRVIRSPGLPLVDTGYYLSFRHTPEAQKLLQSMDIVHVHHPFLSGRLAIRYCDPLNIPTVFTNHTRYDLYAQAYLPILPEEVRDGLLQAYMPPFCEAMSLVISPSAGMANVLCNMGVTAPIVIVPNGVDLKPFLEAQPLRREDFGFQENDVLLAYAGRLAPEKNLPLLIQAFAGVTQVLSQVKLMLIGSGPKQTEAEIRRLIGKLDVSRQVYFTGMVPYEKLPSYLAMCDAFVTASVTEVHPLSVIEGMAAGLPVIGVDSPGVGDTVEHGQTGLLANENLAAFTATLTRLCVDTKLRRQMGHAARRGSACYSIERTMSLMLEHYQRLLSETRPPRKNRDARLRSLLEEFLE